MAHVLLNEMIYNTPRVRNRRKENLLSNFISESNGKKDKLLKTVYSEPFTLSRFKASSETEGP